jgi:U6 snRNA-associated Sm-like protein LSm1
MESLTLEETPLTGGPMGGSPMPLGPGIAPPQNQQLPPQMFTTAAQLLDLTDSKRFVLGVCERLGSKGAGGAKHLNIMNSEVMKTNISKTLELAVEHQLIFRS